MAYYARAKCGLKFEEDDLSDTLERYLHLGEYIRYDKDDYCNQGACFLSGNARFMLDGRCDWLNGRGHWQLLTADMFTPEEGAVLKMLLPDLEWYP